MAFISNLPAGVYERDQEGKGYYKVLVVGGRGAQSPEINEIQQIQDSQRAKLVHALFQSGSLMSGGFLSQDEGTKEITMAESTVFMQDYIFTIPESRVTPNNNGESTVGVLLTKKFMTPEEDTELLNPVENTKNYQTRGALRLQYTYSWVAEPNTSTLGDNVYYYPMYSTVNGVVVIPSQDQNTVNDEIYETIARYDNDANGSYIVDGMRVYYSEDSGDFHVCGVNSGSAHVSGKEIIFSHSEPVNVRRALDVQERYAEPIVFRGDGSYTLRHTPIASVSRVSGVKRVVQKAITHGSYSGASDRVPNTPLVSIISVSSDSAGASKYIPNTDYFMDGDSINWSPSGNEPSPGSTYYVTYQYQTSDVAYSIDTNLSSISISGLDNNTTAYVDYSHYLRRVDSIVLTPDGNVSVIEGSSAEYSPVAQNVTNGLVLSTVLLAYGADPYFYNDTFRTFKNSDIAKIRDAIYLLQYNLAQLDLKTDISAKDPATTRKGMFVDPFYDDDQRDQGLEQNAEIVDKVLLPYREWNIYSVRTGAAITLNRTSNSYLVNQPYRTKSRKINEFMVMSDTPLAYITASPATYRWAATFSQVTELKWATTGRLTAARVAAGWKEWGGLKDFANYKVRYSPSGAHYYQDSDYIAQYGSGSTKVSDLSRLTMTSYNYITTEVASQESTDISGTYTVPQYAITITGSNFQKSEVVNIKIDGKSVGSFTTTTSGTFTGSVTTPSGMKSGKKSVVATGSTSGAVATTTISTIPQNQSTTYYEYHSAMHDPIGQTFINENDCFAYSVDLLFAVKPGSPVELRLMETTGGYPDPDKAIGVKVLQPANISTSGWTSFVFDSPVYLEKSKYYAIALISTEAAGEVYVAELGKRDDWNSYWATKNIFSGGTLVQASQEYTWSAVQNEDMTFRIAKCNFDTTSSNKTLGTITIPDTSKATQLYLLCDSRIYPGTSVEYKLNLQATGENLPVSEYLIHELPSKYSGRVTVSAVLKSSSNTVTPYVSGDIQLAAATPVYPSTYITRQFTTDGRYIKVYVDVLEYGEGQVTFQYQDNSENWQNFDVDAQKYPDVQIGNGWVTKTLYKDTGSTTLPTRLKITFNEVSASSVSLPAVANLRVLSTSVNPQA